MILCIDPGRSYLGDRTIGVCGFSVKGVELFRHEVNFEELVDSLDILELPGAAYASVTYSGQFVESIVMESFVNNARSRGGQRNGTSECIGAVEYVALKTETPLIFQQPAVLPVAKAHAGYEGKQAHLPHKDSAYLHGYYYLVKKGVLKPVGLEATLK